jgi:5-(carboxyamino)imidazole ribonucleotide mutase
MLGVAFFRSATLMVSVHPQVAIVMGSRSDWDTMQAAEAILDEFGVSSCVQVVSAHRTPDRLFEFAEGAASRGLKLIIAGAGGAAHLPGMLAAKTHLPVLGVPVQSKSLNGLDSLLSIVQMPKGIPVPTFAIGAAGAANAALSAVAILALSDVDLASRLIDWRARQRDVVLAHPDPREPAP